MTDAGDEKGNERIIDLFINFEKSVSRISLWNIENCDNLLVHFIRKQSNNVA